MSPYYCVYLISFWYQDLELNQPKGQKHMVYNCWVDFDLKITADSRCPGQLTGDKNTVLSHKPSWSSSSSSLLDIYC